MGASKSIELRTDRNARIGPCLFFTLPLEIRHAIYACFLPEHELHLVHVQKDAFCLTRCFHPELEPPQYGLERRLFATPSYDDMAWQKRLLSGWGPHWRCEEEASSKLWREPLMEVCKAIRAEFLELVARTTTIEISLIGHLYILYHYQHNPSLARLIYPHVTHLSVTIILPSQAFTELERSDDELSGKLAQEMADSLARWHTYKNAITIFSNLRQLHLCVDHDEPRAWTHQNQQTVINSLKRFTVPGPDGSLRNPNLQEVILTLPKLPAGEDRPVDWGAAKPRPRVEMIHVNRLRYRVQTAEDLRPRVHYVEEWPESETRPRVLTSLADISVMEAAEARMWD